MKSINDDVYIITILFPNNKKMRRGLTFEHIANAMHYSNIKEKIFEMHKQTSEKLEELREKFGIEYILGEPYFIDFDSQEDSDFKRTGQSRNQRRYGVRIFKNTRKIKRIDIIREMNNIYAAVYKFI